MLFPYEGLMETGKDGKISSIFFFWQHLFSFNYLTFPLNRQWGLLWQDAGNKHHLAVCLLCTCSEKGIRALNHQLFFLSWRRQDRCIKKENLFRLKYSHATMLELVQKHNKFAEYQTEAHLTKDLTKKFNMHLPSVKQFHYKHWPN